MFRYVVALLSLVCVTTGCSHVMSEANMKLVDSSIRFEVLKKQPEAQTGKTVIMGGILVSAVATGDTTTLEVAQLELTPNGVPDEYQPSGGRFLALSAELLEPSQHNPGQLVTVIGEVKGKRLRSLNGVDYPYPLIAIREVRFFRPSEPMPNYHANPYENVHGDGRFLLSPPGPATGEPRRPY